MKTTAEVLTTGQVAKICNVAPRTVSKWFDSGQLRGYRIPGSKDRRIPIEQLIKFMTAHGMPLNGLDGSQLRVLVVDPDEPFGAALKQALGAHHRYRVETAHCVFSAGVIAERLRPHAMLIDALLLPSSAQSLCRFLRGQPALQSTRLIAMSQDLDDGRRQGYLQQGFAGVLAKPFNLQAVMRAVEDAVLSHEGVLVP